MHPVAERAVAQADPAVCGRLIGRAEECGRLRHFVDSMPLGPAVLLVRGEPGIGRTSLWEYGLDYAGRRGYLVRAVRPRADDRPRPSAALTDLLGCDMDGDPAQGTASLPSFDRGRRTLEILRRLSANAPVLLCVDDQHWLDDESANAIRFALDRLTHERVGLMATAPVTARDEIADTRRAQQIELGPLPVGDLRRVLARSFPVVSRPDLVRAHDMSGGNPTAALQLLRCWSRDRRGLPRLSEERALGEQLLDLPADSAAVVRTLALAGPAPAGTIAAAADVDFEHAAGPAVDADVIHVSDDLTVRFTHTMYANAVRAAISPLDFQLIHRRLSDVARSPEAAARHLAAATVLPDEAVAARLDDVAERCARRGSAAVAAELTTHAVRLTPAGNQDAAGRRALLEVVHRAAAGENARAMSLADRLLELLPPGARRAEALTLRVFLDFGDSERFLRQALDEVENDPALLVRILDLLGWQLGLYRGRLAEGIATSRRALAMCLDRDDVEAGSAIRASLAAQLALSGRPSRELFAEAVDSAGSRRPFALGRWPQVFQARAMLWSGELDIARRGLLRAQQDAVALGSEFQRPYRLCDLAILDVAAGDLDSAIERADAGIAAARDAGNEQAIAWLMYPLGLAAALQGRCDRGDCAAELLDCWGRTNEELPRFAMAEEIRGSMAATAGDWRKALAHFTSMVQRLDEMGCAHPGAQPGLPRAVEAATMLGDREACARLTERLARQAAALRAPLPDAHGLAAVGQLALLEGDTDRAVTQLGGAVTAYTRLGYRFDAGRAGLALARAGLRAGRRSQARIAAAAALAQFSAAAAPAWAAVAAELLGRAGCSNPGTSLTRTETQVASLVAAGRLNREIATELFVTVSTVEAHLTRIYRKLGLRHRTELTAYVHANG